MKILPYSIAKWRVTEMVVEQTAPNLPSGPETTREFRLLRKAIKEIFLSAPDGVGRDELTKLAEMKGIKGEDFKNVIANLTNTGHLYYDEMSGKFRYIGNE